MEVLLGVHLLVDCQRVYSLFRVSRYAWKTARRGESIISERNELDANYFSQVAKMFGDDDLVAIYQQDIHIDHSKHEVIEKGETTFKEHEG